MLNTLLSLLLGVIKGWNSPSDDLCGKDIKAAPDSTSWLSLVQQGLSPLSDGITSRTAARRLAGEAAGSHAVSHLGHMAISTHHPG